MSRIIVGDFEVCRLYSKNELLITQLNKKA